jgi:rubredoxin
MKADPYRRPSNRFIQSRLFVNMAKYQCVCGYIYDEDAGCPENGVAPGTKWADVPDDFTCPDCGLGKDDFELIE